jgi:hypothetical protein
MITEPKIYTGENPIMSFFIHGDCDLRVELQKTDGSVDIKFITREQAYQIVQFLHQNVRDVPSGGLV